jgi:hypothetical protein
VDVFDSTSVDLIVGDVPVAGHGWNVNTDFVAPTGITFAGDATLATPQSGTMVETATIDDVQCDATGGGQSEYVFTTSKYVLPSGNTGLPSVQANPGDGWHDPFNAGLIGNQTFFAAFNFDFVTGTQWRITEAPIWLENASIFAYPLAGTVPDPP